VRVIGDYYDEYAEIGNPIRALDKRTFQVEAKINLDDFNEYFSANLKAEDATTLGGYILEKLGEVPAKGKVLEIPEFKIEIHEVIRQRRIRSVIVRTKK